MGGQSVSILRALALLTTSAQILTQLLYEYHMHAWSNCNVVLAITSTDSELPLTPMYGK